MRDEFRELRIPGGQEFSKIGITGGPVILVIVRVVRMQISSLGSTGKTIEDVRALGVGSDNFGDAQGILAPGAPISVETPG